MNLYSVWIVFALTYLTALSGSAQVRLFPNSYGIVSEAVLISNPALVNTDSKWLLTSGNQFYPGPYRALQNHYFIGMYNLAKDTLARKNNVGIKIINEKEGDYISRPKVYASYAVHTPIVKDYYLSAGLNLGYAGYVYKATNISAEGAAFALDGDLAIGLYNHTTTFGLAINQIANSKLLPKNLTFIYTRHLSAYINKKLRIDTQNIVEVYMQKQWLPHVADYNNIGLSLIFHKVIQIGSNFLVSENISFIGGVRDLEIHKTKMDILFCYRVPVNFLSRTNIQSFEIILSGTGFSAKH